MSKPTQTDENNTEGIEIIMQIVKSGKIDSLNIDVADVTDKYLSYLRGMESQNLRPNGRTLLLAASLLKLKANILDGTDNRRIVTLDDIKNFEKETFKCHD